MGLKQLVQSTPIIWELTQKECVDEKCQTNVFCLLLAHKYHGDFLKMLFIWEKFKI